MGIKKKMTDIFTRKKLLYILISFIFVHLSQYTIYFEALDQETLNDKSYCKICSKILRYMKMKLIFYFLLSLIFIVVFWYYVTLFCIIYHNNQVNWIIDCVTISKMRSTALSRGRSIDH